MMNASEPIHKLLKSSSLQTPNEDLVFCLFSLDSSGYVQLKTKN
ncbi:hypothetical protein HanIR_Chr02g0074461 [Helianthus annuus]|nr:hypothetical protein HanIR_Chr02g0074461 [Helianthus annuus]